ncbi:rap1 GTPase-GDP dissociation stimulator 1 [Aricia agestis]|uniref:rap1 GTPase-GDP dissociation stimulator 1 n=1 Tax=Aricia agestis TaxID=91739 RepID=UPI001C206E8F|nr:rap1 GTPase-GDP dissociation stimulator 1 [Aricia agestis]
MEGSAPKKSTSFETLVIQNISNVSDLKAKLNEIIDSGKSYEYDVSSCLKTLIRNDDQTIVLLCVQALAEIVKCESKRETYATPDIIEPILTLLKKASTSTNCELLKHCVRALGNLCCDCDSSRDILLENNGITILIDILKSSVDNSKFSDIKLFTCKTLLNFCIGGKKYSEHLVKDDIIELLRKILMVECYKDCMDEAEVTTVLQLLSVINDNDPEVMYPEEVNKTVLNVLEESTSIDVSDLCLELLNSQAENDSVKTLIAKQGGVQLVSVRLEQLIQRLENGGLDVDTSEIDDVMKQACDLIIVVLTGDEAMEHLYRKGTGEVYRTMVRWLDSDNHQLLTTGTLAIGNFARKDEYCLQLMENKIFDKLLYIFESYRNNSNIDARTATKAQHAALGALRNLSVPAANKRSAARAAPALLAALPSVTDPRLADQLLAALRLLLDGQTSLSQIFAHRHNSSTRRSARWGSAGEHPRAAAEAGRLLARAARLISQNNFQEPGCISCLVNMMVSPHSIMQSEAIVALTLLAAAGNEPSTPEQAKTPSEQGAKTSQEQPDTNQTNSEADSSPDIMGALLQAELPSHAVLLLDTNCGKMPAEVAHNLVALLELTGALRPQYKAATLPRALSALLQARPDLNTDLRDRIQRLVDTIEESN